MSSKQIMFFCTEEDLKPIIENLESKQLIKYVEMGLFDEKSKPAYPSFKNLSHFGHPQTGDWNKDFRYMMLPKDLKVVIREVPQRKGGIKYAIDQLENPTSICFQFGGIVADGVLLAGTCGTSFLNEFALDAFKLFSSLLKKNSKRIGDFYVGKNAEDKLKEGWRLVTNERSPREYDLTFN